MNAPDSGTIKELLVNEEDTVTVGQDLIKLELGAAPEGKKDAAPEEPKEPAAEKPQESAAEKPQESAPAAEKPEPSKPAPPSEKPKETPKKAESPKPQGAAESKPTLGNREERRVCTAASVHRVPN